MPAPSETPNLKLPNPVEGSFGWHSAWYQLTAILDSHPGIKACTSSTKPEEPFVPQVIYLTDADSFEYWNGSEWKPFPA